MSEVHDSRLSRGRSARSTSKAQCSCACVSLSHLTNQLRLDGRGSYCPHMVVEPDGYWHERLKVEISNIQR